MSKIISLTATNYKRLKAVEIIPGGNVVTIAGRNAQGKSSVLDAISAALGGVNTKKTPRPIRDGEDRAEIIIETDDLIVKRVFTGKTNTLTVTAPDGAVYPKGQAKLDAMLGKLSLDPLAFTQLSDRDQRDALLKLVDLEVDLDQLDTERAEKFAHRTDANRRAKTLQARVDQHDVAAYAGLPDEPVNVVKALEEYRAVESRIEQTRIAGASVTRMDGEIQDLEARLASLKELRVEAFGEYSKLKAEAPSEADLAELADTIDGAQSTNRLIDEKARYLALTVELKGEESIAAGLTEEIDGLDQTKTEALESAAFPVEGLGFDADGVTFGGVPFRQASSAEQIRVSFAMAVAASPELRVVRISDGSLLDSDSLAVIGQMADEFDCQVWIEVVSDGDGEGIVIEDGEVLAVDY